MQKNQGAMDKLFEDLNRLSVEESLKSEKRLRSEVRAIDAFLEETGLKVSEGRTVMLVYFKEPIEKQKGMVLFTFSDGCAFCGYNEDENALQFYSLIPRDWEEKFPKELSSQTLCLCPACCAELYLKMRNHLGAGAMAKELLSFLAWYSCNKTLKP